ncbi:MAG: hypothetical protein RBU37_06395 [Myxococcota bacterium]|nr:hypothetical protein [Myxococcota bacterium]
MAITCLGVEDIELGGTGQAPNRQELGERGQAPNRQEVSDRAAHPPTSLGTRAQASVDSQRSCGGRRNDKDTQHIDRIR